MAYTKRTCHKCGYRDIQPNMRSKTIEVETGSSKDDGSWATYFAATFANDKAAQRRLNRTTWANNKRKYTRKKQVWECKSNCGNKSDASTTSKPPRKKTLTKEEKELAKIEKQIETVEKEISNEARLFEAKARIKELELLERQNMTFIDHIFLFIKDSIKYTFYLFVLFVILTFFGII